MEISKKKIIYNGVGLPVCEKLEEIYTIDAPDYWTRLEHTYAGMAMQGILMNEQMQIDLHKAFGKDESMDVTVSEFAIDIADTLIQKLKEKEERK